MYAKKILNSILEGDSSAFPAIGDKVSMVFDDKEDRAFYEVLYGYFLKYDKIPSRQYLDDFFAMEKSNPAVKSYTSLLDEGSEVTDDLPALIQLQIRYNVKQATLEETANYQNRLKIGNSSDIKELSYEYQSKISEFNQFLEDSAHKRGLLYGEDKRGQFEKKYRDRKESDQGYYIGKTGFPTIDNAIGGIHSVDKITLLGFTNQGKSPLMRQIGYNLIQQGLNGMMISLEMNYDSIETSFYTLHANNHKVFGLNKPKITTKSIKEGTLTEEEEDYLFNEVIDDFNLNENYGSLYILQPEDRFCMDDLIMEVTKVHITQMPLDFLLIDYAVPLILPSKTRSSFSTEDYNSMHRRLRLFGLSFDHGRGLPIIDCCQSNRAGFDEACSAKNTEKLYKLTAIGDYNSIERDSTHIMSILQTPDMKAEGLVQFQHLKSRESNLFPHYKAQLDGATGWIRETASLDIDEDELSSAIEELEL